MGHCISPGPSSDPRPSVQRRRGPRGKKKRPLRIETRAKVALYFVKMDGFREAYLMSNVPLARAMFDAIVAEMAG